MKAVLYNKKELPHKLSFCDIGMLKENDDEVLVKLWLEVLYRRFSNPLYLDGYFL